MQIVACGMLHPPGGWSVIVCWPSEPSSRFIPICTKAVRDQPQTMFIWQTEYIQGWASTRGPGLGWLRFGMFHHPAWAVDSYSSGPPARETPKILVNPTQVREQMPNPVELHFTQLLRHVSSYLILKSVGSSSSSSLRKVSISDMDTLANEEVSVNGKYLTC